MTDGGAQPDDPEVVRAQIAETRQALGDTVDALVEKTDVKGRVAAKLDERRARLRDAIDNRQPAPLGALVALFAVLATVLLLRRARHR
jgi:hypothetical protein